MWAHGVAEDRHRAFGLRRRGLAARPSHLDHAVCATHQMPCLESVPFDGVVLSHVLFAAVGSCTPRHRVRLISCLDAKSDPLLSVCVCVCVCVCVWWWWWGFALVLLLLLLLLSAMAG
jgi:hypothetical protein